MNTKWFFGKNWNKPAKVKHQLNKIAKKEVEKFINSRFWKRILTPIKNKEKELIREKDK